MEGAFADWRLCHVYAIGDRLCAIARFPGAPTTWLIIRVRRQQGLSVEAEQISSYQTLCRVPLVYAGASLKTLPASTVHSEECTRYGYTT